MGHSRIVLAAVAGLLALSACSSGSSSKPAPKADPTAKTWTLTYDASTSMPLASQAYPSDLHGQTLLITYASRRQGEQDRVGTVDVGTGRRAELARLSYAGGEIIGAVRTGTWVVYGEESNRGIGDPGSALWRILALGPQGQRKVLATSAGRHVIMTPDLTTVDGAAEWTVYPSLKTFSWSPGQPAPQREDVQPGDANECTPPAADPELVIGCVSTDRWIAWTEKDENADTVDPAALFYASAAEGSPHKLADFDAIDTVPAVFGDYLLWDGGDGIHVTSLEHPSATTRALAGSADSYTFSTDGTSAVIVSRRGNRTRATPINVDDLKLTSH